MHRLLVAASLLLPAAALAQDIPHRVRPETVPDSWAAPYIGAYYAVAAGGRSSELADEANISSSQTSLMKGDFSGPVTGSMVELFAGRNWRFGNFIVGGQVEATVASDIAASVTGPLQLNQVRRFGGVILSSWSGPTTNGNDPQLRFRAGLVGRAGFLVRPNLLLYGLAGLEFGHFIFPDDDDAFGSANRNWALGYTAGAGLEARYDDHWSLRAEYRYLHFATARSEVRDIGTYLSSIRHHEVDMHVGKVGLVYSFGGSGPSSAMAAIPPLSRQVWADSWAGPYAGIYFGAGAGHAAENYSSVRNLTNIWGADTTTTNQTKRGQFAGGMDGSMNEVFLGYNWRSGRAVAGVQAEGTLFSDVGLKPVGALTTTMSSAMNGVADPTTLDVRPGWNNQQLRSMVGLAGRAGFLATPDLLLYGVGGVEFGHFVYPRGRDAIGGNNGKWAPGYTAGAGAELRMTDHWSLRGEYRYLHFDVDRNETIGSASVEAISGDTSEATTNTARQTAADFHIGKIGVVYKFGGAGPASAMAAMPPSLASTWTDGWAGPYFGAYFSAGAGVARGDFATISTSSSVTFPQNAALAGTMTGMQTDLFAGYSLRSDRFVVGGQVEATQYGDVAVKMAGMQTTLLPPTSVQTSTLDQSERLRSMVSVVGRAGFLATPNLLLYGLGGLALGHFKYPEQGDRFPDPVGKWVAGYTVGAGGELKVARHWSLRAEYRYLHFDIERGASYDIFPAAGGSTAVSFASRTSTDFHLGKVGLVYRVGEDSPSAMAALPGSAEACCDRWTGFSAGIYGAGGAGRVRDAITSSSDNRTLFPPPVILSGSNDFQSGELAGDVSGGMIDLFAGYNWRAGQFVIGGQVEATVFGDVGMKSRGTLVGTSTSLVPPLTTVPTIDQAEFAQLLRSRAGLIGRAGLLATPNLLVYALAGAEFGHFTFQDTVDQVGGAYGKWAFGYTAGAGAELKLTDRWSVRGEYRIMRFNLDREAANVFTHTDVGFAILSANSSTAHTRTDLHFGKVGVAYTFCYCD